MKNPVLITGVNIIKISFSGGLSLADSAHRAGISASAAIRAAFRVDNVDWIAFADRANRTFINACAACGAFFGDNVSHYWPPWG
jgi:hypothetical protein